MKAPEGFVEIPICPMWFISKDGDVWTGKHNKMMTPTTNGVGYYQLIYRDKGTRKKHYIHRLVAKVFIGPIEKGLCVNHKDGIKSNNHYTNLEIVTRKENNDHAVETGLRKKWRGSVHPQAKLTESDVLAIRRRVASGEKRVEVAKDYGIVCGTVSDIIIGKSWSWLE